MRKNIRNITAICLLLTATLGIYSMQSTQNQKDAALLSLLPVEADEALLCSMPPLVAVGSNGPDDCFLRGTFIDFQDISGPSYLPAGTQIVWTSDLPGFNTTTGNRILRTYYVPPTLAPGCYTITANAEGVNFPCTPGGISERSITIRIKGSASENCEECETVGGPGIG